ncbi:MAG: M48 family metallopeptidase [Verrucomicrobiae bacterium]|nr:M48 family metallopeptidase [Verrucomicrobiae bacterium]
MVDFFGHQDRARRQTGKLVFYFAVAIGLTICLVYLAVAAILLHRGREPGSLEWLWNSELFMWASAGTLAVVFLGSLFKIIELSAGGKAIAEMLGGRPVSQNTSDPDERKLLNVIEEMAIASGVPVPDVYLMDHENGINAFAAGTTVNDAVIGVTRGCVRQLDRAELQGVMAHEFSHILNGDMKLNLRLTGWIHGLLCIAIIGRVLLHFGGSSRSSNREGKGGNPLPIIGLALMVVGGIGMLFAKLIKAAVSRQREFLADASAVQFTRNPDGISGALKKIGGLYSKLDSPKAEEASHLFFGNGLGSSFMQAFATHPPLEERIRRIDPKFAGEFSESPAPTSAIESQLVAALAGDVRPAPSAPPPVPKARVMEQIGRLDSANIDYARGLVEGLPTRIVQAAHEPFGAVALCYSLLLSSDPDTRRKQTRILQSSENAAIVMEVDALTRSAVGLDERARIPLIEMSVPALRQIASSQYATFIRTIRGLSEADRQIDLFEFSLEKILRRHLEPAFTGQSGDAVHYHSLEPLLRDVNVLLSALAYLSHDEDAEVRNAYSTGVAALGGSRGMNQLSLNDCGLAAVDQAMDRVALADARTKERIVTACVEAVTADGEIRAGEGELLRAVCAVLNVPCPPLI